MTPYPSLYQINTRVLLHSLGPRATLDDVPDVYLDHLAAQGFSWVWLLGIWQIGTVGPKISAQVAWRDEYERALPDLTDEDITGSPFAIHGYVTDRRLGGDRALASFRERLHRRNMKLLVDFVPNHVAIDHPWTESNPEYFIEGTAEDASRNPHDWIRVPSGRRFAHGRDPNYPGWTDTLQLNYFEPKLHDAMINELASIASRADGVRCDMAMLLEPEVFERTWHRVPGYTSRPGLPFWERAIESTRAAHPYFLFMAEVYWNYEHRLQLHGFDYTYDKVLYDRLTHETGRDVRLHLRAEMPFQEHSARFLENHDEPRIASLVSPPQHKAAATVAYFAPGLRFFHQGQLDGRTTRIPVHLRRGPSEEDRPEIRSIYDSLLPLIHRQAACSGRWWLLECVEAWGGNVSHEHFICQLMRGDSEALLVTVNYSPHRGQAFVRIPQEVLNGTAVAFSDLLSGERYERSTDDLRIRGLYLDVPEWNVHVFELL